MDDVLLAGENAFVSLYCGKHGDTLDRLRYQRYYEELATNGSQLQPQNLPPTSAAACYHSLRVYLRVKQWQGKGKGMSIEDWGWRLTGDQIIPVMTDLPAAPESLLRIVRCNCSSDCVSERCTCRKYGLECSPACGQCRSTVCANCSDQYDNGDEVEGD